MSWWTKEGEGGRQKGKEEMQESKTSPKLLARRLHAILGGDPCARLRLATFLKFHGSRDELVSILKELEKFLYLELGEQGLALQCLWLNSGPGKPKGLGAIYEVPTDELCKSLLGMIHHLGVRRVLEVGAGTGLLSARLKQVGGCIPGESKSSSTLALNIETSDACDEKYGFGNVAKITYTEVARKTFEQITSDPLMKSCRYDPPERRMGLIISWLHSSSEESFLKMIGQIHPRYVWHIGTLDGEVCYSTKFLGVMAAQGYAHMVVYAKQLSQLDYFYYDKIRQPGNSTGAISFFYKRSDLSITKRAKNFLAECGIEKYLGGAEHFQPCTERYMEQNLRIYDMLPLKASIVFPHSSYQRMQHIDSMLHKKMPTMSSWSSYPRTQIITDSNLSSALQTFPWLYELDAHWEKPSFAQSMRRARRKFSLCDKV